MTKEIMTPKIKSLIEFNSRLDAILFADEASENNSVAKNADAKPSADKQTAHKISTAILADIKRGTPHHEAFDKVLGAGAYKKLAGEVYDGLRAKTK